MIQNLVIFTAAAILEILPQGFWPVLNQGTPAILFSFVWLYLSAAGPGMWSVDAWMGREEPSNAPV